MKPHSIIGLVLTLSVIVHAQPEWLDATTSSSIVEKFDVRVPVGELEFKDETGTRRALGGFFHPQRPALLLLVYYECPGACSVILSGAMRALKAVPLQVGDDYDVIVVSVRTSETWELAAQKKQTYMGLLRDPHGSDGWHFLTGTPENAIRLAFLVGYSFIEDEETGEILHGAGAFVLSPDGRLRRTLFGAQLDPRMVRLALIEAGDGAIGAWHHRLESSLMEYDSFTRTYQLSARRRWWLALGIVPLAALGLAGWRSWRRRRLG